MLIEKCGLKGEMVGGAIVSEKHANFIINKGSATAKDIYLLSKFIKEKVKDKEKINLEEEVKFIGFD
jgi:UDP-N-acetylmuramate dehydrogenase